MLHHLALTASGLNRSLPFYDAVLSCLGYTRTLTRNQLAAWEGPHPEILLYQAKAGQEGAAHTTYDPGIHHIAFRAETRAVVDQVQECIIKLEATILDSAREYPHYAPGYYAVFFLDPDGIKFEVMHV